MTWTPIHSSAPGQPPFHHYGNHHPLHPQHNSHTQYSYGSNPYAPLAPQDSQTYYNHPPAPPMSQDFVGPSYNESARTQPPAFNVPEETGAVPVAVQTFESALPVTEPGNNRSDPEENRALNKLRDQTTELVTILQTANSAPAVANPKEPIFVQKIRDQIGDLVMVVGDLTALVNTLLPQHRRETSRTDPTPPTGTGPPDSATLTREVRHEPYSFTTNEVSTLPSRAVLKGPPPTTVTTTPHVPWPLETAAGATIDYSRACRYGPTCPEKHCGFRHTAWQMEVFRTGKTSVARCKDGAACRFLPGCILLHEDADYLRKRKQRRGAVPHRHASDVGKEPDLPLMSAQYTDSMTIRPNQDHVTPSETSAQPERALHVSTSGTTAFLDTETTHMRHKFSKSTAVETLNSESSATTIETTSRMQTARTPQYKTLKDLAAMSSEQVLVVLGEMLYSRLLKMHPVLAPKITGMLLEMEVVEILSLLNSNDLLSQKANEAVEVVFMHQGIHQVVNTRETESNAQMLALQNTNRDLLLLENSFAPQAGNIAHNESRKRIAMADKFFSALAEMKKRAEHRSIQSARDKEAEARALEKRALQSHKDKARSAAKKKNATADRLHESALAAALGSSSPVATSSPPPQVVINQFEVSPPARLPEDDAATRAPPQEVVINQFEVSPPARLPENDAATRDPPQEEQSLIFSSSEPLNDIYWSALHTPTVVCHEEPLHPTRLCLDGPCVSSDTSLIQMWGQPSHHPESPLPYNAVLFPLQSPDLPSRPGYLCAWYFVRLLRFSKIKIAHRAKNHFLKNYTDQPPDTYPHEHGSNICWITCTLELLRNVTGITDPRIIRYFNSSSKAEKIAAQYALRRGPEDGKSNDAPGIGRGVDPSTGYGFSHDLFESLGAALRRPWGAKAQVRVFEEIVCAGGHFRSVGMEGPLRDTLPLQDGETGIMTTPITDDLQSEMDSQMTMEFSIPSDEATPCESCNECTGYRIRTLVPGGALEVVFIRVLRFSFSDPGNRWSPVFDVRPTDMPLQLIFFGVLYELTTICTVTGNPLNEGAHFIPWRLYNDEWFCVDDLKGAPVKVSFSDIPRDQVYALAYVQTKSAIVVISENENENNNEYETAHATPAGLVASRIRKPASLLNYVDWNQLSSFSLRASGPVRTLPLVDNNLAFSSRGIDQAVDDETSATPSPSSHRSRGRGPDCAGVTTFSQTACNICYVITVARNGPTPCPIADCRTKYCTQSVQGMRQHLQSTHGTSAFKILLEKKSAVGKTFSINAPNPCGPLDSAVAPFIAAPSPIIVAPPSIVVEKGTMAERIARVVTPRGPTKQKFAPLHVLPPEVENWEVFLNNITSRKSMRRVMHAQKHLWQGICESICGPFATASEEGRDRIMWELMTAVKRYLYLPAEKTSARGTFRLIRERAQGSFDSAPHKISDEGDAASFLDATQEASKRHPGLARAERLVKEGALGKAARAVDTKILPPHPEATQREIINRVHPEGPSVLPANPDRAPRFADLDWDYLSLKIRNLPRSAAPGPSGWTRELIVMLSDLEACRPVISALLLGILNDTLSDSLRRSLSSSLLILLTKEVPVGEDPEGRPIAMGELFTKLAAGIAFDRERGTIAALFGDLQLGALKSQGTETIILRTRQEFRENKNHVMVTLDLRNAFNAIHRDKMMRAIHYYKLHDLYNIVEFLYGRPSALLSRFAPGQQSKQGVRQGDPLGPILFSLGIHPTLVSLAKDHPKVRIRAYLDDVTVLGLPTDVAAFLADFTVRMAGLGLVINERKCKVATHHEAQFEAFKKTGLVHTPGGQKVLGAFIANNDEQESAYLESKVDRMTYYFTGLTKLERQCSYTLFRYCGLPRWTHFTRTHNPVTSSTANGRVDELACRCLATLMGGDPALKDRLFANSLFASDLLASVSFVKLAPLAYAACLNGVNGVPNTPSQHDLVGKFMIEERAAWLKEKENMDPRALVHATMLSAKGSRLWLECRPNRGEYFMNHAHWEVALRIRYLLPPTNERCVTCVCGHQCDTTDFVVHALSCNKVSGYTWASRHALVKKVFKSVLAQYGFRPDAKEPRFNGAGPDVCFMLGLKLTLVDVVICNPLAESYVQAEAEYPGTTLARAEVIKNHDHLDAADKRCMDFHPLALTIFGQLGRHSLTLLRKCSRFTADPRGFMAHMATALAVAVQNGNAQMVLAATHTWWSNGVR